MGEPHRQRTRVALCLEAFSGSTPNPAASVRGQFRVWRNGHAVSGSDARWYVVAWPERSGRVVPAGAPGKKPPPRSLYAIATGANDYRDDQFNNPMNPADVIRNIEEAVVSLYELGARDVMVVDLPDLGKVPANAGNPGPATDISLAHNGLLGPQSPDCELASQPSPHICRAGSFVPGAGRAPMATH